MRRVVWMVAVVVMFFSLASPVSAQTSNLSVPVDFLAEGLTITGKVDYDVKKPEGDDKLRLHVWLHSPNGQGSALLTLDNALRLDKRTSVSLLVSKMVLEEQTLRLRFAPMREMEADQVVKDDSIDPLLMCIPQAVGRGVEFPGKTTFKMQCVDFNRERATLLGRERIAEVVMVVTVPTASALEKYLLVSESEITYVRPEKVR